MKLLTIGMLVCPTIFTLTSSLAISSPPRSSLSLNDPSLLHKRGLICSPTGPGVCNFGLENNMPSLSDVTQYFWVSDYTCKVLGYVNSPDGLPYNFYSQLPYVVVVTAADTLLSAPHIAFRYGASSIDSDNGQCACSDCSEDLDACVACRCAFDC